MRTKMKTLKTYFSKLKTLLKIYSLRNITRQYTHTNIRASHHTHMHVQAHIHTRTHTKTRTSPHTYTHEHTHVRMHVLTQALTHASVKRILKNLNLEKKISEPRHISCRFF